MWCELGGRAPWDKVPDAAQLISASHLAVLEQAAVTAQAAEENERGIAYAAAALHISLERYSKLPAAAGSEGPQTPPHAGERRRMN